MQFPLKGFLRTVILPIETAAVLLRVHFKQLSARIMVKDFFSVASSIGFVSIPAFLAGLIFIMLPQGRDTLLLVVEKLIDWDFYPLFFLLISILIYSGFAELGVRYAIYISDNSGRNLTDARVFYRKTCQKLLAAFFLLWPFLIIIVGLGICFFRATYLDLPQRLASFGLCFFLICWLAAIMILVYFKKYGTAAPGQPQSARLGERSLAKNEQQWLKKLYGIYDDYIYTLPKPSTFKGAFKQKLIPFTALFKTDPATLVTFLQDTQVMEDLRQVPKEFKLTNQKKILDGKGELFKWIYFIPTSFYKTLHRQIIIISIVSLILLFGISLIGVKSGIYQRIGAPALVCLAFGSYCGLYTGLLYLDKALLRSWRVSVRFLLIIALITFSLINNDHPVTMQQQPASKRYLVADQFNRWFKNYKQRVDQTNGLTPDSMRKYPVFFVCAEGGALRTGAYTGIYLMKLEDTLSNRFHVDLRNSIFAMSGVSGGAVGLGLYNALAFRSQGKISEKSAERATTFFEYDALSPLIGKMLFGEFLNLFWPRNIELFNRAVALEKSWESAYGHAIEEKETNVFESGFIREKEDPLSPLLIINTLEVETGLQCWVSTLQPDSLTFLKDRDLLGEKVKQIKYSTAINFSTRFPLLSPAAAIGFQTGQTKYHYLDGGYIENTGSASMLETMDLLRRKSPEFKNAIPVMIFLLFSDDSSEPVNDIDFGNEITEVVYGIYNTRAGRTKTSLFQLQNFVKNHNQGINIFEPLTSESVPMNWVLSNQSIENINRDIAKKLKNSDSTGILQKIFSRETKYLKK